MRFSVSQQQLKRYMPADEKPKQILNTIPAHLPSSFCQQPQIYLTLFRCEKKKKTKYASILFSFSSLF